MGTTRNAICNAVVAVNDTITDATWATDWDSIKEATSDPIYKTVYGTICNVIHHASVNASGDALKTQFL